MMISLDETEEVMNEIQKIPIPSPSMSFKPGDIVRWSFELKDDPQYGTLYMVVGFNSEMKGIVVTRILNNPYIIREFHMSQLKHV